MGTQEAQLIWSIRARADVRILFDYISQDSPRAATRYVLALQGSADILLRHPRRGRPLPEGRHLGPANPYRVLRFKRHRLIYTLFGSDILVVTVVHEARQFRLNEFDPRLFQVGDRES